MAVDLRVTGASELEVLGRRLKEAGAKELKNELVRTLKAETKPLRADIKKSGLDNLPQRGGLNRWASSTLPSATVRDSGSRVGVRIRKAKKGHDIRSLNRGRLRHPVFGHRDRWVQQDITPGFFDKPIPEHEDALRERLLEAIRAIADRL